MAAWLREFERKEYSASAQSKPSSTRLAVISITEWGENQD
jgi:hypothetical protein